MFLVRKNRRQKYVRETHSYDFIIEIKYVNLPTIFFKKLPIIMNLDQNASQMDASFNADNE